MSSSSSAVQGTEGAGKTMPSKVTERKSEAPRSRNQQQETYKAGIERANMNACSGSGLVYTSLTRAVKSIVQDNGMLCTGIDGVLVRADGAHIDAVRVETECMNKQVYHHTELRASLLHNREHAPI